MDVFFIFGEIFSLLAAVCLCYSTFSTSKKNMVFWQLIDSVLGAVSNIFLFSFSGVVTNILVAVRNLFEVKGKNNNVIVIVFCFLNMVLGLLFNNRGFVGVLPILATIEYTIAIYVCKSSQSLRIGLLINTVFWGVYDLLIMSYPLFVADVIIFVFATINVVRLRNSDLVKE